MIFLNDTRFKIGKIEKTLSLPRFFFNDYVKWHWKKNYFTGFYLNIFSRRNPHIAIVGESGSGKSNLCKLLLKVMCKEKIAFMLLDPHNEYVESARELDAEVYDAAFSGINIFDLEGLTQRERTSEITSMFKRIFRLGDVQSFTLYKCIAYTYKIAESKGRVPNIHDLIFTIKVFMRHASAGEKRMLEAIEKRLMLIDSGAFMKSISLSNIIEGRSIFALSSLHTSEAQSVYIEGFLKKLYTSMLSMEKSGRVRLYIVIDEAEKLGDSSIISRLVAEGRKYGIGVIGISQRAKVLDRELRGNASLLISFSQHEPEESNYIANYIAGGNELNRYIEVKKAIRNLKKGAAIVLDSNRHNPMLVSFNLFKEEQRDPTHAMLMLARNGISKLDMYAKLKRRGYTIDAMNHAITKLLSAKSVKSHTIQAGEYAGTWYITFPRNSAEHDINVCLISKHLAVCGRRNVIYNNSYGPDVIAFVGTKKIAVEYETGMNDFAQAKKMIEGRKSKFSEVIVVANESCHERYKEIGGITLLKPYEFFSSANLPAVHPEDNGYASGDASPADKIA
ncbi:MAG: ATP-binding protein [Candidatus Micrarchaeales archaeon]